MLYRYKSTNVTYIPAQLELTVAGSEPALLVWDASSSFHHSATLSSSNLGRTPIRASAQYNGLCGGGRGGGPQFGLIFFFLCRR